MSHHPQVFQRKLGSKRDGGWYKLVEVLPPAQILYKSTQEKQLVAIEAASQNYQKKHGKLLSEDNQV